VAGPVDVRKLRADDLRYLLAVADTGRLVAAADALSVDHTTVSRRVRALEKTLGVRLVERGTDGGELTETGRAVAEEARPIQEALERAANAAAGVHEDSLTGTFRITAPDGFGTVFVVPALARLRQRHPNLSVELSTATRQLGLPQSGFGLLPKFLAVRADNLRTVHVEQRPLRLALTLAARRDSIIARPSRRSGKHCTKKSGPAGQN
jgi:DNA-binding transcriptional LysR family regulator